MTAKQQGGSMLLQNGQALLREQGRWGFFQRDVRVVGGRIEAVAPSLAPRPDERRLDLSGLALLPGMVNAHVHSYTNLLKGTSPGEPLELWGLGTVALGGALTPDEMALSARLGVAEMLRRGVTACIDHIPHAGAVDAIAGVYRESGFRAAIAPMLHDRSDHLLLKGLAERLSPALRRELEAPADKTTDDRLRDYEGWLARWHRPDGTLRLLIGPNSPQRCTRALLAGAGELAHRHGLGVHAHLLESRWQRDTALDEGDPVAWLDEAGLLGENTSLAHCVWLTDGQIDRLAARGCTAVHNPTSNLFLGSGVAPVSRLRGAGIPLALGSDGCNCATSHNLLEIARTALLLQRSVEPDPAHWLSPDDCLDALTLGGARALGQPDELGLLAPGQRADLVACARTDWGWWPDINPTAQLLFSLPSLEVRHVMVEGRLLLKDGVITAFDEAQLRRQMQEESPRLRARFADALDGAQHLRPYVQAARDDIEAAWPQRP